MASFQPGFPDKGPGVSARLGGSVEAMLPMSSPWRVVMVAPTAAKLLENNAIILNLNEPCAIKDTSWIKPGTVLRDLSLTTEGAKQTIDYCSAHHIGYMIFDAGWYGPEKNPESDSTKTNLDPARSKGPFDLPKQSSIRTRRPRGSTCRIAAVKPKLFTGKTPLLLGSGAGIFPRASRPKPMPRFVRGATTSPGCRRHGTSASPGDNGPRGS